MLVKPSYIFSALMNVMLYVPIGIMMPTLLRSYSKAVISGFLFSVIVNLLQLITTVGAFELDDIFHNTIGMIVGCVLCYRLRKLYWKRWKAKQQHK